MISHIGDPQLSLAPPAEDPSRAIGIPWRPGNTLAPDSVQRSAWQLIGLAFGLIVLGSLAVIVSGGAEGAAWWPAGGLACAVVAAANPAHRRRTLVVVLVATLIANLLGGHPTGLSTGFALANTAEAWLFAVIWTDAGRRRGSLYELGDVARLVAATAAGSALAAIVAAASVAIAGDGSRTMLEVARIVLFSHATSALLFVPFIAASPLLSQRSSLERAGSWIAATGSAVLVFSPGNHIPLAFLPTMFATWAAVRLGVRTTTAQVFVIGVTAVVLTQHGGGPFQGHETDVFTSSMLVQILVLANAVVLIPLSIAVAHRDTDVLTAQASELMYRAGFAEAMVGMLIVRLEPAGGRVVATNDAATAMLDSASGMLLRGGLGERITAVGRELKPGVGWTGEVAGGDGRHFDIAVMRLGTIESSAAAVSVQLIDTTDRRHMEARLTEMAMSDDLTGLLNRTAMCDQLERALDDSTPHGDRVAVVFIDVDNFKDINDAYGHLVGDQVLIDVANRLRSSLEPEDVLARIGGDEFVVLCRVAPTTDPEAVVARIEAAATAPITIGGLSHHMPFSAGIAISDEWSTSERLLRHADAALYDAKSKGKRRVSIYNDAIGERVATRLRIEADLLPALDRREFEMHMQPVIDIPTGRIVAAEALIRWRHPVDGLRPPGLWLDAAERSGLLPELGAWALDESVRQASTWIDTFGPAHAPAVHVNVSARQIDRPGFSHVVIDTLARHRFPAERLVLELTETHLASVPSHLVAEFEVLAALGVQIAADDYGTGYSPLTRVVELPVSMIKIDRQFVDNMNADARANAVVMSLLRLAEALDLQVVAEGVETSEQLDALEKLGCRTAQGYLWSKPLEAGEFTSMLHRETAVPAGA